MERRTFYAVMWQDYAKVKLDDYIPSVYGLHDTWREAFDDLVKIMKDDHEYVPRNDDDDDDDDDYVEYW